MKKPAIIIAAIMLLAPISEALAGAAAWQNSQRRMRQAYARQQASQAEFWRNFDGEMAPVDRGLDGKSNVPATGRKRPCQPK